MRDYFLTSESVSEGHPDKIADQISDAILDAIIAKDKMARVACETIVKTGMVLVFGEISTFTWVDIEKIAREVVKNIGYVDPRLGFDYRTCAVLSAIGKQSADIAMGVDRENKLNQGAGDQGIMFGFASDETPELMPAPISYAHKLMERQAFVRKNGILPYLFPDAKSQVTLKYENDHIVGVDAIVLSSHHAENVSLDEVKEGVLNEIIKPVFADKYDISKTKILINPTGRFTIGGPVADAGLTGRKIIVDTYGGAARHGGGAFSGKDPSKVDRTAAYMARHIAKSIVASGIAKRCEIQLSYAIGVAEPVSILIDTFGTGTISEEKLVEKVRAKFDLRPKAIIDYLDLLRPIYLKTASYGHFGRDIFPWEKTVTI